MIFTCRRCGLDCDEPKVHYAIGKLICPGGDQEFVEATKITKGVPVAQRKKTKAEPEKKVPRSLCGECGGVGEIVYSTPTAKPGSIKATPCPKCEDDTKVIDHIVVSGDRIGFLTQKAGDPEPSKAQVEEALAVGHDVPPLPPVELSPADEDAALEAELKASAAAEEKKPDSSHPAKPTEAVAAPPAEPEKKGKKKK